MKGEIKMRFYINCPFSEKDEVKSMGAKWDTKLRSWFYEAEELDQRFDKWQGENLHKTTYEDKNLEYITSEVSGHNPFIAIDLEATGIMNGNDNKITQIALSAYAYNDSKGRYELQDHIFMLAKANKNTISAIQQAEAGDDSSITKKLQEEFAYKLTSIAKDYKQDIMQANSAINEMKKEMSECKDSERKETLVKAIWKQEKLVERKSAFISDYYDKIENGKLSVEDVAELDECKEFVAEHLEEKRAESSKDLKIKEILSSQGIDMDKWISSGDGLTANEMQLGITEFFNNNLTDNTMLVTNGEYYTKHYLKKENIIIGSDKNLYMLDVLKAARKYSDIESPQANKFACNFKEFSEIYQANTGRKIENFDAFTKTLCMAEMVCRITGSAVVHNSEKHLENSVKEAVMKTDDIDYGVMSERTASSLLWEPENNPYYCNHDNSRMFDSLEYVDFGSERRYVDIEALFEVNNNFEITLEGEKEPIENWDELEAKIKSYNADISEELLSRIKSKYEELEQTISEQKENIKPQLTVESQAEVSEINEPSPQNEQNELQALLQSKLNAYDNALAALEEENKNVVSDYEKAVDAVIKKAETELPYLLKFAEDATNKIGIYPDSEYCIKYRFLYYTDKNKAKFLPERKGREFDERIPDITFEIREGKEAHNGTGHDYEHETEVKYNNRDKCFDFGESKSKKNLFAEHYEDIKQSFINAVSQKLDKELLGKTERYNKTKEKTSKLKSTTDKETNK